MLSYLLLYPPPCHFFPLTYHTLNFLLHSSIIHIYFPISILLSLTSTLLSFLCTFSCIAVCSSAPINMKVQHVNSSALVVRWARPEVTYHPPILHFLVSYSWTAHDDSYEETHLTDAKHKLVRVGGTGACSGRVGLIQWAELIYLVAV